VAHPSTGRFRTALLVPFLAILVAPSPAPAVAAGPTAPYVVVLRDEIAVGAFASKAKSRLSVRRYEHALRGFAARLTHGQRRALERDPAVDMVVPDRVVELTDQILPTGVNRVEADRSPTARIDGRDGSGHRVNADIAIIDTGIQKDHPDLNVVGGRNCTSSYTSAWGDPNGHGTHVAGVAAAKDNGIGVVGVAPGARLWSVRVFLASGYSRISWIVCGIDWITSLRDPTDPGRPRIEVANMSLRDYGPDDGACGSINSDAEHRAICRSVAAGTTYVVSAGNDRDSAARWRPASYNEVITVSAIADFDGRPGGLRTSWCTSFGTRDRDDTFADFSNYGGDVDITAPGKCIRSTYKGSSYAWISGTSMSTPAVAGGAALYKAKHADATPKEIRLALRAAASDDWATWTDPDSWPDPLLDVSSFGAGPDLRVQPRRTVGSVWAGYGSVSYPIHLVRRDGFAGPVQLSVEGLPDGATASWTNERPTGLAALDSTATIRADRGTAAGRYSLVIRANGDDVSRFARITLVVKVDRAAPTLTSPRARFVVRSSVGSTAAVRVGWKAWDSGTGIRAIELDERRGGGFDEVAVSATTRQVVRRLAFGHEYTYRVRARDRVGNETDWRTGQPFDLIAYGEGSNAARYSAGWRVYRADSAWGDRAIATTRRGAAMTFRFAGRELAWIGRIGSYSGWARIYIDGRFVARVNLYSAIAGSRRIVFTRTWSTVATRTLRIVNEATPGHPRIEVDGFAVRR
jgi:subtilisin family serine protease